METKEFKIVRKNYTSSCCGASIPFSALDYARCPDCGESCGHEVYESTITYKVPNGDQQTGQQSPSSKD